MKTTRHEHRGLIGILGAFATVIAVLALTLALTPSPASAETPAERCKRETAAYNNAWKAIGKKPPVPYKCGGNNQPPPTLSPTEPTTEAPDAPSESTTSNPKGNSDGPTLNAPTERRELEHPSSGQPTVGGGKKEDHPRRNASTRVPGRTTVRTPANGRSKPNVSTPQNGKNKPQALNRATAPVDPFKKDTYKHNANFDPTGTTPPPSDPANDGCKYCTKDSRGRIENGPANSPDGWINNWGCPEGTHNVPGLFARCYTDYDWYIENRRLVSNAPKPGQPPVGICARPTKEDPGKCVQGVVLSNQSTQSVSKTSSKEGKLGAETRGINVGGTLGESTTTTTGTIEGMSTTGTYTAPADLKPGEEIAYYQRWELWTYDIVSERDGEFKRYAAYQWVPTSSVYPVRGPVGSHLEWK